MLTVIAFAGLVLAVQIVRLLMLSSADLARRRRRRDGAAARPSYLREWLRLWAILMPAAAAIFVSQEELEHRAVGVAGHGLGTLWVPSIRSRSRSSRWSPVRSRPSRRCCAGASARSSGSSRQPLVDPEPAPDPASPRAQPSPPSVRRPLLGTLGLAFDAGRAPPAAC